MERLAYLEAENQRLKNALESLQTADVKYRAMLTRSPVPTWLSQDGVVVFVNPALLQLLGAESEDRIVGHPIYEFIHPDFHEFVRNRVTAAVESGFALPPVEERFIRIDGLVIERQVTAMPLPYEEGKAVQVTLVDNSLEKALKESNRILRLISDNTTEAILAYDMDRKLTYVNAAFERLTGIPLQEMYARDFINWIHPDDEARMLPLWDGLFRGEAFSERTYRLITREGKQKWASSSWAPIHDETGRQVGVQGRERDITEEKEAEEARRQSDERFRIAFAQAAVGAILLDPSGRFTEVNSAFCEITGYSEEELKGVDFRAITHPGDLEVCDQLVNRMLAGSIPGFVTEKRFVRKDEATVWAKNSVSLVRDSEGIPRSIIGLLEETTERRRAEAEVRESEERFRTVFENGPLGMSIQGRDFKPLKVNAACCEMLGYSAEEFCAMKFSDYTHPEDVAANMAGAAAILRGESTVYRTEKRYIAKSGKILYADVTVALLRDSPWEVLTIINNITDRKLAEEALRHSEEQLRQAQKMEAVGLLAGGVAHDFNNILTVINGYSTWLLDRHPEFAHRDALTAIHEAGERAAALTQQLLALSRKQVLQPRVFDLPLLIRRMVSMLRRVIRADVVLRSAIPDEPACIKADPAQIEQVILNLVINASDAMPQGGAADIAIEPVRLDSAGAGVLELKPGEYTSIVVTDTGTGIDPAIRPRIFEPFFTTKALGKGTGLGLPTAFGIVKQSGGNIAVRSTPGAGSTFTVYLPLTEETPSSPAIESRVRVPLKGQGTILVVEDNPAVRMWGCQVLKEYGYRVLEASDGLQALQLAVGQSIDLLITDVIMPGMNGRQLAERFRPEHAHMKVLFVSGYADDVLGEAGEIDSEVVYLAKPFGPEALLSKVDAILGRRIVLADDDPEVRKVLASILEAAGYHVRLAENGREAMLELRRSPAHMLITDLAMPEQEGIETIRAARREFPDLQIVAMSGVFGGAFTNVSLKLGAGAVLQKPIEPQTLLRTLEDLLLGPVSG